MIMVDPKMVEMQDYKSIPHLMAPIIDDMGKAESILEWATQKMDEITMRCFPKPACGTLKILTS